MGPQVTKFVETCQVLTPKRELLAREYELIELCHYCPRIRNNIQNVEPLWDLEFGIWALERSSL